MPYNLEWDNPDKTVLLQTYSPPYHLDDLYAMATKSAEILKTVSHRVYIIIDERTVNRTMSAEDMLFLEKIVPHNQGAVVLVINQSDYMYRNLLQNLGKAVAPHAFGKPTFFATLEEARQYLQASFGVQYPSSDSSDSLEG